MVPEIKKILFSTDLSENANYAFGYAASIANRFGAGITLLHVLDHGSPYRESLLINVLGEKKWQEIVKENEANIVEMFKDRLKNFCDEMATQLPACEFITDKIEVKVGHPVDMILEEVEKTNCDLVVMGAHGHGVLGDAMMGSVSRRVLRRCQKPVLVVRLPEES